MSDPIGYPRCRGRNDSTVGFVSRGGDEPDVGVGHPSVSGLEVLNLKEEADSSGDLLAYDRRLVITIGSGEQDPCLSARRTNNDPPFRLASVRQRWGVFDQLEAESVNEERNRRVIVIDDNGRQLYKRHLKSMARFCRSCRTSDRPSTVDSRSYYKPNLHQNGLAGCSNGACP